MSYLRSRTAKALVLSSEKALSSLSVVVLAVVLARTFSKAEFATYQQTLLIYQVLAPLIGLGMSNALMYFLPTDRERGRGIILEAAIPLVLMSLVYYIAIVVGGNHWIADLWNNPRLATTLVIVAPLAIFMTLSDCIPPSLIATDRVIVAAIFNIFRGFFVAIIILLAVWLLPAIEIALASQVLALAFVSLVAIYVIHRYFQRSLPTWTGVKSLLTYGIPLGLTAMVGILSRSIDRVMVSSYCRLEDFAVFDRGAMEIPLIGIVTSSMTAILMVDYRLMFKEGRQIEILPLLHRTILKSGTILIPTMCFLLCLAPECMVALYGEQYRESASVFRIYLCLLPIRTLVFGSIALAAGKTRALAIVAVVTLTANAILNFIAIGLFGYLGCALATVVVIYFVSAYGRAIIAQNILDCSLHEFFPWRRFSVLMLVSAVATPVVMLTKIMLANVSPILSIFICLLIYALITLPLLMTTQYVKLNDLIRFFNRNILQKK